MAKEKKIVKTETTAEAYVVEVIEPKIDTIQQDINQTKLDQKTCLSTIITHNDSLKEAFEEMKQQKAEGDTIEVCTKEDVRKLVKEEVSSSMKAALKGFSMKASIADSCYERIDQRIEKMDASLKRPPLMKVNMNISAKILVIIITILLGAGVAGYFWFVNTPMYLGHTLYKSYIERHHPYPASGYHLAYQEAKAGRREDVKARIKLSRSQEADFQLYADTLRRILKDSTIYINGIRYGEYERLVDYTDRTDVIKSAHFRKDGSVRITEDQRMLSLEDARNLKLKWKKVR
ncbi:MAG: hypothetical protein IKV05_03115 [Bacteroidales bacterium]|nr:hypothetical protein [Bacteroidales bacterium]